MRLRVQRIWRDHGALKAVCFLVCLPFASTKYKEGVLNQIESNPKVILDDIDIGWHRICNPA